ncbi:beta-1,2-xylosyltransferase XYXT1 [Ziziphus jujuba]|uniref:Beta-1,2-xylosyltransferase XYXT1 n=1 Tax=Ziziphus jujuba TaxID=326968 RepID=A0A6P3ZQ54_ZIZJJ|nr:beta-1,2-xylosyltransferase XYXT1 [Ziziphus jujuba]
MYDSMIAKSFSKHEQKKIGYGGFVCSFFIVFCFFTLLVPYLGPVPSMNLQVPVGVDHKMLSLKETNTSQPIVEEKHNVGMTSKGSRNVSLQMGNSSYVHSDSEITIKGIGNVSFQTGNSTSPQKYLALNKKGSEKVTLEVENSTSLHHTDTTSGPVASSSQHTETPKIVTKKMQPLCNTGEPRTDFCEIKMDVWIDGKSGSVFTVSSQADNNSWIIKPYARKEDSNAMRFIRKWTVKSENQEITKCSKTHNVPAVLFSLGGYVGNHFHDITEVLIPLFITSRQYNGEVQLLVSNKRAWWIEKFQHVLKGLSKYKIIDIDKEKEVHCFPTATIGLKRHPKELSIDPLKHYYSMTDFKKFLRNSYSLNRSKAIRIVKHGHEQKKPRLLIISRRRTRTFTNTEEISKMARSLGFEVIVAEAGDMSLSKFAEIVNSCDVLMGVHGAGLTNMVFLPDNAVFVQILSLGKLQGIARTAFQVPATDMKLKYLEYEIAKEESTLINQYPIDHAVFTNPSSIKKQGWVAFGSIYLDKQNVNLNVNRFRPTLLKALKLLHH